MPQTEMSNKPAGEGLKNVGGPLGIVAPEFRGDRAKTLNMATGGIPAFVKEDVIPTARKTAETLREAAEDISNMVAPYSLESPAKFTAKIMRSNIGEMKRSWDRSQKALKIASDFFGRSTKEQNLKFIDNMERGLPQSRTELDEVADVVGKIFATKVDQVRALGTGKLQSVIENYFPHVWKDPKKAEDFYRALLARRPLEGSKSFLKKRTIEFTSDGIEKGLEPISYNPIDLVMFKIQEMDRYIMAQKTIQTLKNFPDKKTAYVKFFRVGEKSGPERTKLDDSISTVYSRDEEGHLILRGHYYAQRDVARIMNNYLSKGLNRFAPFRAYRQAGNVLNQFQLGLSAFHLGFTSMDATISRVALGINELGYGRPIKALGKFMSAPLAPITNPIQGDRLIRAWEGNPKNPLEAKIADLMAKAGGQVRMDRFYANEAYKSLKGAIMEGNLPGAALRLPFAVVDLASKPILEYIVPRQKLGVFFDMMKMEIDNNPNATTDELVEKAQLAWDSVDNRMGQLVYDNLFWNKTAKDLAMASARSVGWNLGTFREIGGGAGDFGVQAARLFSGQKSKFTYRMAYIMALPIIAGLYGAIYMYLRTGKKPKQLWDYFYPQNGGTDEKGNPTRDSLPTYMKDVFAFSKNPVQTVINKFQPMNATIAQMLQNRDYFGTKIRNEDDPLMTQLKDEASFVGEQFVPFGIRNVQREMQTGGAGPAAALPFVGITPAPAYINKSNAQQMAEGMIREKIPAGARTKEAADKSLLISNIERKIRMKDKTASADISKALKEKKLGVNDIIGLFGKAQEAPIQKVAKRLSLAELEKVMKAATPEERRKLISIYQQKKINAFVKGTM